MEKWFGIISLVSYNIPTLSYYKMVPPNDSIKKFYQMISLNNFHYMESIIESWRLCARSLCDLVPLTSILLFLQEMFVLNVFSFFGNCNDYD